MASVPLYISYARIAQYEEESKNRKDRVFKGGALVPTYSRLLYILQTQIAKRYALDPTDSTLNATAEYMFSLTGSRTINTTPVATPFIIVIQPQSQTISSGSNVSFSVSVAGGVPAYTYQWYFNNVAIGGATSSTYSITGAVTGDAGNYKCIIMDANSQTLTTNNATLIVNAVALAADWYWNATIDPYPALAGGTDNLTYLGSVSFTHLDPIVIPWPSGSADNVYRVVRYPIAEGAKILWVNTGINQGAIPGPAYNEIVTIGSNLYIISKGDSVFSPFIVTYT